MSIHSSKGGKELRREKRAMERKITGAYMIYQHTQILMEESMLMIFYTNIVFFYAGKATVSMPYYLRNFQLVVSVLCTHSIERELKAGISIEAGESHCCPGII